MDPLKRLAERHNVAVLIVNHIGKDQRGKSAADLAMGSSAFKDASRQAIAVTPDKNDKTTLLWLLTKTNYKRPAAGLTYRIDSTAYLNSKGETIEAGKVVWTGTTDIDPDDAFAIDERDGATYAKTAEAARFLQELLADGPLPVKAVEDKFKKSGYAPSALRTVKGTLGVASHRQGFGEGSYHALFTPQQWVEEQKRQKNDTGFSDPLD